MTFDETEISELEFESEDPATSAVELSSGGLTFHSKWEFPVGTCLSVGLQKQQCACGKFLNVEGVVVDCKPEGQGRFEITLAFLDDSHDLAKEWEEAGPAEDLILPA